MLHSYKVAEYKGIQLTEVTEVTEVTCYTCYSYTVAENTVAFITITSYLITSCAGTVATGGRSTPAATRSKARFP